MRVAALVAWPAIVAAEPDRIAVGLDTGGSVSGHFAHHEWIGGDLAFEDAVGAFVVGADVEAREFRYLDDECYARFGQYGSALGTAGVDLARAGANPSFQGLRVTLEARVGLSTMRAVPYCHPRRAEYDVGYSAGLGVVVEYDRFRIRLSVDQPTPFDRVPHLDWIFVGGSIGGSWSR